MQKANKRSFSSTSIFCFLFGALIASLIVLLCNKVKIGVRKFPSNTELYLYNITQPNYEMPVCGMNNITKSLDTDVLNIFKKFENTSIASDVINFQICQKMVTLTVSEILPHLIHHQFSGTHNEFMDILTIAETLIEGFLDSKIKLTSFEKEIELIFEHVIGFKLKIEDEIMELITKHISNPICTKIYGNPATLLDNIANKFLIELKESNFYQNMDKNVAIMIQYGGQTCDLTNAETCIFSTTGFAVNGFGNIRIIESKGVQFISPKNQPSISVDYYGMLSIYNNINKVNGDIYEVGTIMEVPDIHKMMSYVGKDFKEAGLNEIYVTEHVMHGLPIPNNIILSNILQQIFSIGDDIIGSKMETAIIYSGDNDNNNALECDGLVLSQNINTNSKLAAIISSQKIKQVTNGYFSMHIGWNTLIQQKNKYENLIHLMNTNANKTYNNDDNHILLDHFFDKINVQDFTKLYSPKIFTKNFVDNN